jgi:hypothetical protein
VLIKSAPRSLSFNFDPKGKKGFCEEEEEEESLAAQGQQIWSTI